MYKLTPQLEQEILFHIWTTRDYLKFALEENAIDSYWKDMLADHQKHSEVLLNWLFELRSGDCPTHNDLCDPQEDVFI